MLTSSIKEFLDRNEVKYVMISYSPAVKAQEISASADMAGKERAKALVVRLDDRMAMAVLPGSRKLDLERLRMATGAKTAELAAELEIEGMFPVCEPGTMPPFGNLYGMEVFADSSLAAHDEIVFSACSHSDWVRLAFSDYQRLVNAKTAPISA